MKPNQCRQNETRFTREGERRQMADMTFGLSFPPRDLGEAFDQRQVVDPFAGLAMAINKISRLPGFIGLVKRRSLKTRLKPT